MRKPREILRLYFEAKLNERQIAKIRRASVSFSRKAPEGGFSPYRLNGRAPATERRSNTCGATPIAARSHAQERAWRAVLMALESVGHLSLEKDTPEPRPIQPPSAGQITAIAEVGGLHHRYECRAA